LLGLVPDSERLVIVEDSSELEPDHPHAVCLQARPANVEGAGAVTLRDLVRQALRMRPDRVVVGEVRGAEVVDLLAAMNTGHEGGSATLHANSARDVPARLEALGLMAGLDRFAVHALAAAGIDAVLHLERGFDGQRRLTGVHALERDDTGLVHTVPALTWTNGRVVRGNGFATLRTRTRRE
jgi:pilus assembly protein CpaF